MRAMIFAAGHGTRLRPLTDHLPKALVEINGTPLLAIALKRLMNAGCTDVVINIHAHAAMMQDWLKSYDAGAMNLHISDERDHLLETGGGLKRAAHFFQDEPFVAINADILTNLDLAAFYQAHLDKGGLATLAVQHRQSSRYLLFDQHDRLMGWRHDRRDEEIIVRSGDKRRLAFSGQHVIDPKLFTYFPEENHFSIIDTYLAAAAEQDIFAYLHDGDLRLDVGTPERLIKAQKLWS